MLLDCMYVNVKYYLICVKLFKNAIQICDSKRQCVSTSGGPQTSYRGSAPGPCWGTSPRTPCLCSYKISFKNPLARETAERQILLEQFQHLPSGLVIHSLNVPIYLKTFSYFLKPQC